MLRVGHKSQYQAVICLMLAVALSYANALVGGFQFDDYRVIVDNPAVQSWVAWRDTNGQGLLGLRPVLKLSYVLNATSGFGAAGFHLLNVLIHLGNTMLVYCLGRAWLIELTNRHNPLHGSMLAPTRAALWTALLFAVHPVHTEAVTYICGRSASLMTLFYLAGLWQYASARNGSHPFRLYVLVPSLFILALGTKETAVTFPLALVLWDCSRGDRLKQVARRQWHLWILLLAGLAYFLLSDTYRAHMQRSLDFNSLSGNVATQSLAFVYLMRQWILPFWLNIDPDLHVMRDLQAASAYLCAAAACVWVMVWCWRRRPWISFALAWAVVHLVPIYLVLPRIDVANDRQMYLASWPLAMALAAELAIWLSTRTLPWVTGALVVGLAGLTVSRNQDYENEITLWQTTSEASPNKARVHNNLGYAYKLAGRFEEARREYDKALQLDPNHVKARDNLHQLIQVTQSQFELPPPPPESQ